MSHFAILLFVAIVGIIIIWLKTKRLKPLLIFLGIIMILLMLPFLLFLLANLFGAEIKD